MILAYFLIFISLSNSYKIIDLEPYRYTYYMNDLEKKERFVGLLNEKIINHLAQYSDIVINKTNYSIPHILNISLLGIKPETFVHAMEKHDIYFSTNTACSSGTLSTSVMAIYNDLERAKHTIRISLSHITTTDEVNKFLKYFSEEYEQLKGVK